LIIRGDRKKRKLTYDLRVGKEDLKKIRYLNRFEM
jgi:hypothetical protein